MTRTQQQTARHDAAEATDASTTAATEDPFAGLGEPEASGAPEAFEESEASEARETPATPDGDRVARPRGFGAWYRSRPLVGGAITVVAGIAMFFSSQLELGHLTVHVGIEGMQATILPIVISLTGALAIAMPAHRIFYGVIALVASVYSLVAVNLGGFFIGFLLGSIGGVMVVSWAPRRARHEASAVVARTGDDGDVPDDDQRDDGDADGARADEAVARAVEPAEAGR